MANFAIVIELERHITKLLLDNDCVIVPGFGGFMTHHVEAEYDEEDGTFYPPLRTLGFNPQLKMNDSMLVQSFVEVYDISYPEALSRIESDVDELRLQLEEHGAYEMYDLGTISLNADGRYEFVPCEAGILTPCLYGLTSYSMESMAEAAAASPKPAAFVAVAGDKKEKEQAQPQAEEAKEEGGKTYRLPVSAIRYAAVACIVVAMFLLFPSSTGDNGAYGLLKSKLDTNLIFSILPKDMTFGSDAIGKLKSATSKMGDSTLNAKPGTPNGAGGQAKASPKASYGIVLASKVTYKNANRYVKMLHAEGYEQAKVLSDGKLARVIYKEYDSKEEASKDLNKLNDKAEFVDAWILKIN